MTHSYDRGQTVVVEDRGSGFGTLLGILVILALLAAVWWFTLGPGTSTSSRTGNDANVPAPTVAVPSSS
ncbi:MAG: hypothetical protein ACJ77N_06365 [Chloroflexota bacterium]|jgi:hypothetical protein